MLALKRIIAKMRDVFFDSELLATVMQSDNWLLSIDRIIALKMNKILVRVGN
jgi:hypothetical protein